MFLLLTAFLYAGLLQLQWPSIAEAEMVANCTFGNVTSLENYNDTFSSMIQISGRLPSSRNLSHSCVLRTANQSRVSYLRAKRDKESEDGSLHLSVLGKDESFLGHLDISKSARGQEWSSRPFCPYHSKVEAEKYVTFSGTPGLHFSVEMSQALLTLDKPETVELSRRNSGCLFQFIPPQDISETQLDVTVTSTSDTPAYLKVSKFCKDVTEEQIQIVDYRGESIRLSFAKKGRITLSKVSIPPLDASMSSWFIGMALKKDAGAASTSGARKSVTITLKRSFDYSSAVAVVVELFLPALLCGFIISFWALWCFQEPLVNPSTSGDDVDEHREAPNAKEILSAVWYIISKHWFRGGPKTFSYTTSIVGWVLLVGAFQFVFADWYLMIQEGDRDHCYYNDFCYRVLHYDIPFNLMISNLAYIVHALILTFSVLLMEAKLFARCKNRAIATQSKNEYERPKAKAVRLEVEAKPEAEPEPKAGPFPTPSPRPRSRPRPRPSPRSSPRSSPSPSPSPRPDPSPPPPLSEPADNAVSPEPTALTRTPPSVPTKEVNDIPVSPNNANANDSERLPWHVLTCPNIFPHLTTMSVPKQESQELTVKEHAEAYKRKFSFTIGYAFAWALFFEGLFSTLYHLCPSKMTFQFDTAFMFVIAGLIVILYHNGIESKECSSDKEVTSDVGAANFFLAFIVPLYIFNYFGSLYHSQAGLTLGMEITVFFLLTLWCLIIALWAGYKLYESGIVIAWKGTKDLKMFCNGGWKIVKKQLKEKPCRFIGQCVYVVITVGLLVTALVFFTYKPSTDKADTPEKSRDLNHECIDASGFFDYHDLWHILSSFALLMAAHLVMYVSCDSTTETERNDGGCATDQTTENKRPDNVTVKINED